MSTGRSARHATLFFLQDVSAGAQAGTLSTLGTVSVRLEVPPTGQLRDRIRIGGVDFGDFDGLAPVSADWGFDRGQPIDRYYIERFLHQHARDIRGDVLEIGDDAYTRRFGGNRVSRSDVLNVDAGVPGTTIAGDLAHAPAIAAGTFDCVILTQTLQLIYDVEAAVRTIHRILRPGGVLLTTFPGITHTKDTQWSAYWCWSFTRVSARRLFETAFSPDDLLIEGHGNVLAAVAFLEGLAVEDLAGRDLDQTDPAYDVTIALRAVKRVAE